MRRDDRDDPFDDFFREIERMMEEMTGGNVDISAETAAQRAVDIVALRISRALNQPSRESRH